MVLSHQPHSPPLLSPPPSTTQWFIGRFFYRGSLSIPRNFRKAARYLKLAAQSVPESGAASAASAADSAEQLSKMEVQAGAEATALLGQMYLRGDGFAQNNQSALEHFRRAYKYGSSAGTFGLGLMYYHGIVVTKV